MALPACRPHSWPRGGFLGSPIIDTLEIVRLDAAEAFESLRTNWGAVYAADPHAEVFVSWAFLDSWRRIAPDPWIVLAAHSGDRYVAFLPLAMRTRSAGGLRLLRELYMAGKPFGPLTGFVAHPDHEEAALTAMGAYARTALEWDEIHLDEVIDPRLEHFLTGLRGPGVRIEMGEALSCPYLPLPDSFDDYLAARSRKKRRFMQWSLRHIEALEGYHVTVPQPDTVEHEIDTLLRLWQARWGAASKETLASYHHMYGKAFEEGRLYMRTLWSGETPIASLAAFLDPVGRSISYYTSGFDDAFSNVSPGKAIVAHCIRDAIAEKYEVFDFLVGGHSYKIDFFGAVERYAAGAVASRRSVRRSLGRAALDAAEWLRGLRRRASS